VKSFAQSRPLSYPVPSSATSLLLCELLGRVRLGFLVVSPFRIACVFLHVERGRSSKRVLRIPRIPYSFSYGTFVVRCCVLHMHGEECSIHVSLHGIVQRCDG
jgi:hypothetical protein